MEYHSGKNIEGTETIEKILKVKREEANGALQH